MGEALVTDHAEKNSKAKESSRTVIGPSRVEWGVFASGVIIVFYLLGSFPFGLSSYGSMPEKIVIHAFVIPVFCWLVLSASFCLVMGRHYISAILVVLPVAVFAYHYFEMIIGLWNRLDLSFSSVVQYWEKVLGF